LLWNAVNPFVFTTGGTMSRRTKKWWAGSSVIGMLALVASMGIGMLGVSTSAGAATRPHRADVAERSAAARSTANARAKSTTHSWHNTLASNTNGWCDASPPNSPCDGLPGDYGTIGIFKATARESAWGGYASGVTLAGQKKYARTTGGQDGGVPTDTGCTVPTNESCSGPYTLWGPKNLGNDVTFGSGFTTSLEMYVDAGWGDAHPGNVVDWDTALQTTTEGFESDFVIDLCSTATGWQVGWENGSGGCGASPGTPNPEHLNTSGWYTLTEQFTNLAGVVYATYTVTSNGSTGQNTPGTQVWTYTQNTGFATATTGGPLYGWLPTEDVSGLPLAQLRLAVN
jgi:hypothetical protein